VRSLVSRATARRGAMLLHRLFAVLASATAGCAKLPLVAGLALVVALRVNSGGRPEVGPVLANLEAPPADFQLIDSVLAKRAPELGEHNEEILKQLGFDAQEIDGLRASGAITSPKPLAAAS